MRNESRAAFRKRKSAKSCIPRNKHISQRNVNHRYCWMLFSHYVFDNEKQEISGSFIIYFLLL